MYLNRPILLVYDESLLLGPTKKEFLYYIEILRKENICFFNFGDAAKFINKTYNNLDSWWNSKNLQKARKLFCNKYCKHSDNPVKDFKKSLIFNE